MEKYCYCNLGLSQMYTLLMLKRANVRGDATEGTSALGCYFLESSSQKCFTSSSFLSLCWYVAL